VTARLLTAREVADLLSVSTETTLRWTRTGKLVGYRLPGGQLRYRLADVEAWLDGCTTSTPASSGVALTEVIQRSGAGSA
jgi:excisionase family DNA binding protein